MYCLLYTDNVQKLFQRSKGITNVKHSTKIVNEFYYFRISKPGIAKTSKRLSNHNQPRSMISYAMKYFIETPEKSRLMIWSSSHSGLAFFMAMSPSQHYLKFLSRFWSHEPRNIMQVWLVKCHLRTGRDVPLRMWKQAAAPEVKKIMGQVRD